MSQSMVVQKSISSRIVSGFFILSWRFFTGAFMDGKEYNDATWFQDATKRGPERKRTWWKRKARIKRAIWRNEIFWSFVFLTAGFIWSPEFMVIMFVAFSPFLGYVGYQKFRKAITTPFISRGADSIPVQGYTVKPKVRRFLNRISRKPKPGIVTKQIVDEAIGSMTPEMMSAIVAEGSDRIRGPVKRVVRSRTTPNRKRVEW